MEKEKYNHINWWHKDRMAKSAEIRIKFADELAILVKERWESGRSTSGVKLAAATNAGLASESWDPQTANNSRRSGASRLLKHKEVIARLLEHGIVLDRSVKGGFRKTR